ncbi:MAG: hypothetical protein OHK0019_16350 [Saprospiraceae bacterium]
MIRQTLFTLLALAILATGGIILSSFSENAAEIGKCGYYADSFHGRPTASGEKYNKNALTCSHKTLPFGTKIRVTRLDNKKTVVVRVNDRGPFIEGYIVDVSSAAAKELDIIKIGSTRVKIEVVESAESSRVTDAQAEAEALASNTTANTQTTNNQSNTAVAKPITYSQTTAVNTSPKGVANTTTTQNTEKVAPSSNLFKVDIKPTEKKGFGIQVTSLSNANNVLPIINELQAKYPGKVLVNVVRDEFNNPTYKVLVGPFPDKKSADATKKTVAQKYKKVMVIDLSSI